MKKAVLFLALVLLSLSALAQQISEESIVINIEVPVRVFDGQRFVDNLTIRDFEIFEDGQPQDLAAVYLIKKRSIERSEENKRFTPKTARNFYLFFEVTEYTARIGEAVEFFIDNVIFPGDNLWIVTPVKTYRLRAEALVVKSRPQIVNQLKGLVRKDTLEGNSSYRTLIEELNGLVQSMTVDTASLDEPRINAAEDEAESSFYQPMFFDEKISRYADLLGLLDQYGTMNQAQLLNFADRLKGEEGQKYVFVFYQREFIPQLEQRVLNYYTTEYQDRPDIQQRLTSIFEFYKREISFDVDVVKQAYADSSIAIHFLFISKPAEHRDGMRMAELSDSTFGAFMEMAEATGGYATSSANVGSIFKEALASSENYYLLYYIPKNFKADGRFKDIRVGVKNGSYRVVHRLGYYAN